MNKQEVMSLSQEEKAQILSKFDVIFVGDASGSMENNDTPSGQTRWKYMQESVVGMARQLCKLDADGCGLIIFSGQNITVADGVNGDAVNAAFQARQPGGRTPTHTALAKALELAGKSDKPDLIVLVTDGEPDDQKAVEKLIIDQANKQERDEDLTILFLQVGRDADATKWLRKLDDDLQKAGAKFDIVDVMTVDEMDQFPSVLDAVIKAIVD